ncbi:N-6 DNA methylase [Desertibacillus haloalkaliphilus]|uniref:N-6 DNA methylase n=1 Tax=Desertibacillus haloalkaliphilus TaxID=1328930 RepID=UPI001C263575|nr:N-6 DNA methylase [Desertibacillus haloalkaliphilus]MBU8908969.1 N-6 DNA methylase [Desertibacillus haloalkaliphilus]
MGSTQFISAVWEGLDVIRGELFSETGFDLSLVSITLMYSEQIRHESTIHDEYLWSNIIQSGYGISARLQKATKEVEKSFPVLEGAFTFLDFTEIPDTVLYKFITTLNRYSLPDKNELGLVFKQILYRQMELQGMRGGEHISPPSITELIPQLLDIRSGSVYDGTAGSALLLQEAYEYATHKDSEVKLYGQEINKKAWAIGRLNLFVNGIRNFDYQLGNTLLDPIFKEGHGIKKFDYILMNFPFSIKKWGRKEVENELYGRFIYGLPSDTNADMAFVSHAIASLSENGKAALIVPHGVLFRGGAEGKIRENIIKADLIEAVIGLPSNLFSNTGIPVAILIINKKKEKERKGKIFFFDASEEFKKGRGRNELRNKDIEKIKEFYHEGIELESYSRFVKLENLEDDVLTIPRYFDVDQVDSAIGTFTVNSKEFKESSVPKKTLNDIASIYRGMNMPRKGSEDSSGEDYKVIQLTDVQDGQIQVDSLQKLKIKDKKKAEQYFIQEGDVLISSRGATVKIAIVPKLEEDIVLSHNFIALRPKVDINSYYIKGYLESPLGQYHLLSIQKGSAVKVLAMKEFENILIPIPSIEEQKLIGESFRKTDQLYSEAIRKAEEDRKCAYLKQYKLMGISKTINL